MGSTCLGHKTRSENIVASSEERDKRPYRCLDKVKNVSFVEGRDGNYTFFGLSTHSEYPPEVDRLYGTQTNCPSHTGPFWVGTKHG